MEYEDGNYIKDRTVCPYLVGNIFDDLENKNTEKYKTELVEWKKQLVGDRSFWQICRDKIEEFGNDKKDSANHINELYVKYVHNPDKKQRDYLMWAINNEQNRRKIIDKKSRYWHYQYSVAKGMKQKERLNIEAAKSVPIGNLFPSSYQEDRGSRDRQMFRCPLHKDDKPSFCWYKKTNRWFCFSCQNGHDSIDLYMKLNQVDFKTAVKVLATNI